MEMWLFRHPTSHKVASEEILLDTAGQAGLQPGPLPKGAP